MRVFVANSTEAGTVRKYIAAHPDQVSNLIFRPLSSLQGYLAHGKTPPPAFKKHDVLTHLRPASKPWFRGTVRKYIAAHPDQVWS